jgi:MoaA/NifB/PqqE/SkfB family radical SAM enzyme
MERERNISLRDPEKLKSVLKKRRVYVWGARHDGYAARLVLDRNGIRVAGYIDSSPALKGTTAFGLSIYSPDEFFASESRQNAFVIIASGFFADEIADVCVAHGFVNSHDFTVYADLRRFNYQVDVSGACNLKCISCPRGNWPRHRKPGFMSLEVYKQLLKKILKEDPWTGIITLYNWGEPLLNPKLPEIIRHTKSTGLLSAISSNIAMEKDFEEVVKAGPDWFRISNSGVGENYETTHTGGKWETFLSNCHKLADYRNKHSPKMLVELFFHIYSHNREDFPKMQKLCDEFGFTLRYRHAALAPLDNVSLVERGLPTTKAAAKTREMQFLDVEEVMHIARAERDRPCFYLDHLWIDWDLSVAHCMEWYDPSLVLFENFMTVSLDVINRARINSEHCRACMARGIHRAYCVYGDEKLIIAKSSIPVQKKE